MIDVQVGYTVYTHLTHKHDGTRKGSMLARVIAMRPDTVTIRINKLNKVFYISPLAIVGIRKKETLNDAIRALANKLNNK